MGWFGGTFRALLPHLAPWLGYLEIQPSLIKEILMLVTHFNFVLVLHHGTGTTYFNCLLFVSILDRKFCETGPIFIQLKSMFLQISGVLLDPSNYVLNE